MHMLKDDRLALHQPTQYPTSEELQMDGITFKAFDLGGHDIARRAWRDHFYKCGGIVYLVDSNDKERLLESRRELASILSEDELSGVPVLILGNKVRQSKPRCPRTSALPDEPSARCCAPHPAQTLPETQTRTVSPRRRCADRHSDRGERGGAAPLFGSHEHDHGEGQGQPQGDKHPPDRDLHVFRRPAAGVW